MHAETAQWQRFDTPEALAQQLANSIAASLQEALTQRGQATLVVSGGRTPVALFHALSEHPLDWAQVCVIPADERWVDETDSQSNARMIGQELLRGCAANAQLLSLKQATATPEDGLAACSTMLSQLALPLDMVILGMGLDGHTASLFPDAPELAEALASDAPCHALRPPSQPTARISLTPTVLNNARRRVLHIEGDDKRIVLEAAMAQMQPMRYPIAMALTDQPPTPLEVYWAP